MLPDWDTLNHFHFLRPWFGLFLAPWLAMLILQQRRQNPREMFGGIIAPHLLEHLRLRRVGTGWYNPRNVTAVFCLLMLLILMGPSWRQQPSPLHEDETALVILLDMSASMQQRDIQPSRLRRAKQKVADLLELRPGKKAALIVFAGSAHTVLSLTADGDILNQYLSAATPGIMPRAGKFAEYAIPNLDHVLRQNTAPATVLLLTDGLGAQSASALAEYFREHPHQLVILGVGSETDTDGLVPLEADALATLADKADGHYLPLSIDNRDVRQVNRRIDSHYIVLEDSALPWHDSGYPLLFPAMALFIMWFRRGWTLTWSILAIPLVLATQASPAVAQNNTAAAGAAGDNVVLQARNWFADLWLTPDQRGRLLLQLERYEDAARAFDDPVWKGLAYYYAEDFMRAAEFFSRSDNANALFNEANARAHARDYVRSLARYDMLIQRAPGFPGARENRARVAALVEEINRLSESQQQEPGVSGEEKQLDSQDAIPAQGADEIDWRKTEVAQLTAEELLASPELTAMWLRGVNHDPSNFLAIKFSMQLAVDATPPGPAP